MTKICSTCKKEKSEKDFYKKKSSKDGLQAHCIECKKLIAKQDYEENEQIYKDRAKRHYRKNKYPHIKAVEDERLVEPFDGDS